MLNVILIALMAIIVVCLMKYAYRYTKKRIRANRRLKANGYLLEFN